ncbi:hypothetical protein GGF31_005717 [Allomyces arbusculus]|nr:hypothetical protein GGF31_005717 [Allomyces arbusculus]
MSLNARDYYGLTPLGLCVSKAPLYLSTTAQALLDAGADPTIGRQTGCDPVPLSVMLNAFTTMNTEADAELLKVVIQRFPLRAIQAHAKSVWSVGLAALCAATVDGNLIPLKLLLELDLIKVDEVVGDSGMQPLHVAASHGSVSTVRFLLDRGAVVTGRSSDGRTPLHYAAGNGYINVMDLLISNGASLQDRDNMEWTALAWAVAQGKRAAIEYAIVNDVPGVARKFRGDCSESLVDIAIKNKHVDCAVALALDGVPAVSLPPNFLDETATVGVASSSAPESSNDDSSGVVTSAAPDQLDANSRKRRVTDDHAGDVNCVSADEVNTPSDVDAAATANEPMTASLNREVGALDSPQPARKRARTTSPVPSVTESASGEAGTESDEQQQDAAPTAESDVAQEDGSEGSAVTWATALVYWPFGPRVVDTNMNSEHDAATVPDLSHTEAPSTSTKKRSGGRRKHCGGRYRATVPTVNGLAQHATRVVTQLSELERLPRELQCMIVAYLQPGAVDRQATTLVPLARTSPHLAEAALLPWLTNMRSQEATFDASFAPLLVVPYPSPASRLPSFPRVYVAMDVPKPLPNNPTRFAVPRRSFVSFPPDVLQRRFIVVGSAPMPLTLFPQNTAALNMRHFSLHVPRLTMAETTYLVRFMERMDWLQCLSLTIRNHGYEKAKRQLFAAVPHLCLRSLTIRLVSAEHETLNALVTSHFTQLNKLVVDSVVVRHVGVLRQLARYVQTLHLHVADLPCADLLRALEAVMTDDPHLKQLRVIAAEPVLAPLPPTSLSSTVTHPITVVVRLAAQTARRLLEHEPKLVLRSGGRLVEATYDVMQKRIPQYVLYPLRPGGCYDSHVAKWPIICTTRSE